MRKWKMVFEIEADAPEAAVTSMVGHLISNNLHYEVKNILIGAIDQGHSKSKLEYG